MKTNNSQKLDKVLEELLKANSITLTRQMLQQMAAKPVLTNSDFILLFNISAKTAGRWRDKNVIAFLVVTQRYYYLWTDVLDLLKSQFGKQNFLKKQNDHKKSLIN